MVGGCIDLQLGRRGDFDRCKYWVRNENDENLEEYTHNHEASGIFYAKEITAEDKHKNIVNDMFMFDENTITIYTKALVKLKEGDIVDFEGEKWLVKNCQSRKIHKNNEFMTRASYISYIQLKR